MPDEVRTPPAALAPLFALARELRGILDNPRACAGGVAGTGAFIAVAAGLALFGPAISDAHPPEDDELDIEFMPGALVRKGIEVDPFEKITTQDQRAADVAPPPTVTNDQTPSPDKPPAKPDKPVKPPIDKPDTSKPDKPVGDRNTDRNTPHNDPATSPDRAGDPFGSPDGWSDMAREGDPWATAVLAALNGMTVGSFAGLGQDATYKFQLIVCADGTVDDVRTKLSTGKPDFDGQIRNAITRLKLPKAPPEIAAQLAGKCKKIPYEFTWRGKSSNGTVK